MERAHGRRRPVVLRARVSQLFRVGDRVDHQKSGVDPLAEQHGKDGLQDVLATPVGGVVVEWIGDRREGLHVACDVVVLALIEFWQLDAKRFHDIGDTPRIAP